MSTTASGAAASAPPTPDPGEPGRKKHHVPGEPGVWVFIGGDLLVFAILFLTYLYYRGEDPGLFARSQASLEQTFGAVNTLLLLLSSLLAAVAVRAIRSGRRELAPRLIAGALACGLGFSALKIAEYAEKIDADQGPGSNDFFTYYFILTGLHWFHLIIGMTVLVAVLVVSRRPQLTRGQTAFVEGGVSFWHMVDLVWIVLFPLLYLVK